MTAAEYARHAGITQAAVLQRITAGKLTLKDGQIDAESADREWQAKQEARQIRAPKPVGRPPYRAEERANAGGVTYVELQKEEKKLRIRQAEIKLQVEQGQLLQIEDVQQTWDRHIGECRNRLLLIADEIADKLATESDPIHCREIVAGKIREALAELMQL